MYKLVIVNLLFVSIVAAHSEFVAQGESCQTESGKPGVCIPISKCREALNKAKININPKPCGFIGKRVLTCCEQKTTTTTTPKPTTAPTPDSTTEQDFSWTRRPGRISSQKCQEYKRYVFKTFVDVRGSFGEREDISISECPFDRQELIVGGEPAQEKEFPHMAQFGFEGASGVEWTCGGSLISERFILTAAHCLKDASLGEAKYARMGILRIDDTEHKQEFNIIERIPYPQYQKPNNYHDIGLAKLGTDATLNTWVRPACLYTSNRSPWTNVIASGWGKIDFLGPQSDELRRVILELYGPYKCNRTYTSESKIKLPDGVRDDIMICAGHSKELKDTCQGDSGGPLQVYKVGEDQKCMYDIIGVTSFGKPCGLATDVPAIYTRVSYYVKWIEDIVWPRIL